MVFNKILSYIFVKPRVLFSIFGLQLHVVNKVMNLVLVHVSGLQNPFHRSSLRKSQDWRSTYLTSFFVTIDGKMIDLKILNTHVFEVATFLGLHELPPIVRTIQRHLISTQ